MDGRLGDRAVGPRLVAPFNAPVTGVAQKLAVDRRPGRWHEPFDVLLPRRDARRGVRDAETAEPPVGHGEGQLLVAERLPLLDDGATHDLVAGQPRCAAGRVHALRQEVLQGEVRENRLAFENEADRLAFLGMRVVDSGRLEGELVITVFAVTILLGVSQVEGFFWRIPINLYRTERHAAMRD